jgi:hypothetical protein
VVISTFLNSASQFFFACEEIMLRLARLIGLLVSTLLTSGLQYTQGCAAAWRKDAPPVYISEESAIIVWDQATKTQHFIRKAAFQAGVAKGKEADFGFLVPTPAFPLLKEVGKSAFDTMADIMRPPVKETSKLDFTPALCFFVPFAGKKAERGIDKAAGNVKVLHEQQVAGYDAAVLEASDGKALNKWLGDNGYASRPALENWLDHYVKLKWKITAFKIAEKAPPKSAADELFRPLATGAVRMSFTTERPFFPYREPEEKSDEAKEPHINRLMQVFFLSQGRMAGKLEGGAMWSATIRWTDELKAPYLESLTKDLLLESGLPKGTWLTTFEDRTRHRPQEDLFFELAAEQTSIVPPPIIVVTNTIHVPADVLLLVLFVVGFLFWTVFSKRSKGKFSSPNPFEPQN